MTDTDTKSEIEKTIRMPRKIGEAWLDNLRSGGYAQTGEELCNGRGGYCCLGVLMHGVDPEFTDDDSEDGDGALPSLGWLTKHSVEFRRIPGGDLCTDPVILYDYSASAVNDSHGLSFVEIAKLIEERMEFTDESEPG